MESAIFGVLPMWVIWVATLVIILMVVGFIIKGFVEEIRRGQDIGNAQHESTDNQGPTGQDT